jgi:serine/threonine protein kinase/DNA-binding CsgD family transcriptional regulator/tetratricopeptide (TPR) repeat protein
MAEEYYPDLTDAPTKKERQVLMLIAEDWTDTQICAYLKISINTLKSHRKSLYDKFDVHRRSSEELGASDERGRSKERAQLEELVRKARGIGYLLTPRYRVKEMDAQLSYGSVETYKAIASSYGYGRDKPVFYRRLINDKQARPEPYQCFLHEVEVLACIDHPNIPGLLEFGRDENDHPFFTMSYWEDYGDILEACNDSPKQIDNLLLQLLNVLAYLHWRRIIFNNLMPENIRVTRAHRVFLVNFGNSLLLEQMPSDHKMRRDRQADSASETLPSGTVSEQTDLWALGILIYQLLTRGQHPFGTQPPTPEKLAQAIDELRHKYSVDESMTRIVEKLLSFESQDRYQSALEVTKALLKLRGGRFNPGQAFSKWFPGFDRIELFGRDDELNQLKSALRLLVEERQGSMRLIVGEMGVGKSVLIDQLKVEAWRYPEVIVSYSKAEQERAAGRGYLMWRDILSKLIEAAVPTREVAQATKHLQPLLEPQKGNITSIGGDDSGATIHAALQLFRYIQAKKNPRNGPKNKEQTNKGLKNKVVLLLLDDLQWMGGDSFRVLKAVHSLNLPILIVGTAREFDPTAILKPKDISNVLDLKERLIKLENLNYDAKWKLCRRLLSAYHLAQILSPGQIHDVTRKISYGCKGNPQFTKNCIVRCASLDWPNSIGELDQKLPSEDEISGYIMGWLKNLHPSTQSFLTICALVGRKFDLEVLRKIYEDQDEHRLEDLLFECSKEGILVAIDNKQWEFEHESVYSAAQKLLPDKAEPLYEKVARAIEKTYPDNITYYAQLGKLLEKAGKPEEAASYDLNAARHELRKSAYGSIQDLFIGISNSDWQTALKPPQQAEMKLYQHFAYMGLGDVDKALESARNALEVLRYKIVIDSHFKLPLIKASLKQIWYRLGGGKSKQKKAIDINEFGIAVRCYRALAQLEYFKNNFWLNLLYLMEGLNLCDEIGDDGSGQKADLYAAATIIASPLGPGILKRLIAAQYEELAQNDLDKSEDKVQEIWMRLVLGMYYCTIGKWNVAKKHLRRGMELGVERIDQRRRYEIVAVLYLCLWYCGEWEEARSINDDLRKLVQDDKLSPGTLSQTDLWPQLFDGDRYLYTGEFKQSEMPLYQVCVELAKVDQAAWLRGIGVLTQMYLRREELKEAEKTADEFFKSVHHGPVMPFYATEGFFGALEVYLALLEQENKSKDSRNKIEELLYYLLDQPILAFSKRYPIAKPRSLLYRARYVFITTSRKDKAKNLADLALKSALDLRMKYDEALICEFMGTHLCDDNSERDLKRAFEIFDQLGATWNRDQVGKKFM